MVKETKSQKKKRMSAWRWNINSSCTHVPQQTDTAKNYPVRKQMLRTGRDSWKEGKIS
jgi:hypothetical protein